MPKDFVNWNRCSDKDTYVEVCPVDVLELQEIKVHPETLTAVPVKMDACILCMKCVPACRKDEIRISNDEKAS